MTVLKKIIFQLAIVVMLTSCGGTTHLLDSGNFFKPGTYNINDYYGCCGCRAKYFTIDDKKRKIEQVVYSYTCAIQGGPTKFVFNYNKHGHLTSCDKYVATTDTDFTMPLNKQEELLFSKLDTSRPSMKPEISTFKLSEIRGFKKPADKKIGHMFPIIKKGKLLVN